MDETLLVEARMGEERDASRRRLPEVEDQPEADSRLLEARRGVLEWTGGTCSVSEAAAILGIPEEAVREHVRSGRLLAVESPAGEDRLPRIQFSGSGILPGLDEVLGAMNVRSPWMRVQLLLDDDVLGSLREGRAEDAVLAVSSYLSGHGPGE